MPRAVRKMMEGFSIDETDRMPNDIHISRLDIAMYVWAIVSHLIDLAVDLNVAIRYYLGGFTTEFAWTLAFILLPAFINTAISVHMYKLDKTEDSVSSTFNKYGGLRVVMLVFQMAPIVRFVDALIYSIKSRQAEQRGEPAAQRRYCRLVLHEECSASLLRVVECFLEAAPQQLLQLTLLYRLQTETVHQSLSICSSVVSMGWCLAAYQRAVRFAQEDKRNMSWLGSALQVLWHFLVTLSRIVALSAVAFLYPHWTILAIACHMTVMAAWLFFFDRSPFCSHSWPASIAFSFVMGAVYIFTYIIPVEGNTRYRYLMYYSVCFVENVACVALWYLWKERDIFYYPVIVLSVAPFVFGILFMVVYYRFCHPRMKRGVEDKDFKVTIKMREGSEDS